MKEKKVDFFIIGAPKSGTTAMSEYLKEHRDICFSEPKEPHFFATDMPKYRVVKTLNDYHKLFKKDSKIRGEGSVWYYYSDDALKNIFEYNPNSKIVFMIRNPVEMVVSMHNQALYSLDENISDFKKAWEIRLERENGNLIPPDCRDYRIILYHKIAMYFQFIQKILQFLPKKDQLKIILFDEFKKSPLNEYKNILDFLNVDYDGRKVFQEVNKAHMYRSKIIKKIIDKKIPYEKIKNKLKIKNNTGLMVLISKWNTKNIEKSDIPVDVKLDILKNYKKDIENLSSFIKKDLSSWLKK